MPTPRLRRELVRLRRIGEEGAKEAAKIEELLKDRERDWIVANVLPKIPKKVRTKTGAKWHHPMNPWSQGLSKGELQYLQDLITIWAGRDTGPTGGLTRIAFQPALALTRATMEGLAKTGKFDLLRPGLRQAILSNKDLRQSLGLAQALTRNFYRAALGANLKFAMVNTTQMISSFAEVGPARMLQGLAAVTTEEGRALVKKANVLREINAEWGSAAPFRPVGKLIDAMMFTAKGTEWLNRGVTFLAVVSDILERSGTKWSRLAPHEQFTLLELGRRMADQLQLLYSARFTSPYISKNPWAVMIKPFTTYPQKQTELMFSRWGSRMMAEGKTLPRKLGQRAKYLARERRLPSAESSGIEPVDWDSLLALWRYISMMGFMTQKIEAGFGIEVSDWMNPIEAPLSLANIVTTPARKLLEDENRFAPERGPRQWGPFLGSAGKAGWDVFYRLGAKKMVDFAQGTLKGEPSIDGGELLRSPEIRNFASHWVPGGVQLSRIMRSFAALSDGAVYNARGQVLRYVDDPDDVVRELTGFRTKEQFQWDLLHRPWTASQERMSAVAADARRRIVSHVTRRQWGQVAKVLSETTEKLMKMSKEEAKWLGGPEEATRLVEHYVDGLTRFLNNTPMGQAAVAEFMHAWPYFQRRYLEETTREEQKERLETVR
ncbi:MAG: hypothetical protein GF355_04155 [Candidatus Eisenbacteria bacterium]|nr:hypothetical protein [Candidatus Eisenbacteria bacterium]